MVQSYTLAQNIVTGLGKKLQLLFIKIFFLSLISGMDNIFDDTYFQEGSHLGRSVVYSNQQTGTAHTCCDCPNGLKVLLPA